MYGLYFLWQNITERFWRSPELVCRCRQTILTGKQKRYSIFNTPRIHQDQVFQTADACGDQCLCCLGYIVPHGAKELSFAYPHADNLSISNRG